MPRTWACTLMLVAALLSRVSVSNGLAADGPPTKPNIILILADDLGYGDLGSYGQKRIATPNLDRLATSGTRFTQCYAGSTVCAPSRCCLMTGKHTGHARVRGNAKVPLQAQDVTLAEVLKSAGYATGLFGKWGLGEVDSTGSPKRQGFDEFFGYTDQTHAHNYYPNYLWNGEERFPIAGNVEGPKRNVSIERAQYSPDLITARAVDFLDRHRQGPFFLYYASILPHANNERGAAEKNGMEVPSDAPYSDRDWPQPQKNHAAMISHLDADVGKLLDKLNALGLDRNTIVLFSSDNGPHKEGGADPAYFQSSGRYAASSARCTRGAFAFPCSSDGRTTFPPGRSATGSWRSGISYRPLPSSPAPPPQPGLMAFPSPPRCWGAIPPRPPRTGRRSTGNFTSAGFIRRSAWATGRPSG